MPFFPPIAMLTGMLWHEYLVENKAKKSVKVSAKVFAILCFIMAFVALFAMNFILPRDEKIVIDYSNYILGAAFIVIPAAMLIYLWKNDAKRAFILKILFMAIVTVNVIYSILPAIYNSGQKELVEFVNYSKSVDSGNYSLNTYKLIKPSVIFYAQQKVQILEKLKN
ncbi:MAG: hypothetical protein MZV64_27565 [Ignavibacteriales bacterium]|nr:hypothetical protein [Ignavibacteriales bacterium]